MPVEIVACRQLGEDKILTGEEVIRSEIVASKGELDNTISKIRQNLELKKTAFGFLFFILNFAPGQNPSSPILSRKNISLADAQQYLERSKTANIVRTLINQQGKPSSHFFSYKNERVNQDPIR